MELELIFRSLYALGVVGVVLFLTWFFIRLLGRKRMVAGVDRKLVTVVETTYLSQQAMMHIVRIGTRYFAIGGGASGLTLISELDREQLDTWVENQRRTMDEQSAQMNAIFQRLRNRK